MKYLTTAEAAELIGLSVQRIRGLCLDGRIPGAQQHGMIWMIPENFQIKRQNDRITGPVGVEEQREMAMSKGAVIKYNGALAKIVHKGNRSLMVKVLKPHGEYVKGQILDVLPYACRLPSSAALKSIKGKAQRRPTRERGPAGVETGKAGK